MWKTSYCKISTKVYSIYIRRESLIITLKKQYKFHQICWFFSIKILTFVSSNYSNSTILSRLISYIYTYSQIVFNLVINITIHNAVEHVNGELNHVTPFFIICIQSCWQFDQALFCTPKSNVYDVSIIMTNMRSGNPFSLLIK